jgi:hypothetical protein
MKTKGWGKPYQKIKTHYSRTECLLFFYQTVVIPLNMALPKLLTITLILNLVASTLQSQFIQDDILAFPRYKIVLTRDKVSNADINMKDVEVKLSLSFQCLY